MIWPAAVQFCRPGAPGPVFLKWFSVMPPASSSGPLLAIRDSSRKPPEPLSRQKVKQEAIGERKEKEPEYARITRLDQERLHWPWVALDRRSESSKTDGVVPPAGFEPATTGLEVRCSIH